MASACLSVCVCTERRTRLYPHFLEATMTEASSLITGKAMLHSDCYAESPVDCGGNEGVYVDVDKIEKYLMF